MKKIRVLFVCLGNICRSPTAEGVFRKIVVDKNLDHAFDIDSAGTSGWHIGSPPDGRAIQAAATRGYDLHPLRGRQALSHDFNKFDYILAMDESNLENLKAIEPASHQASLKLFLDYANHTDYREVPDPYYGGNKGFDLVLDLIEDACEGFLEEALFNQ